MISRISKVLSLIFTVIFCIGCFVGCDAFKKNAVEAKYDTLPYGEYVVRDFYYNTGNNPERVNLSFGDSDLILLSTFGWEY